MSGNQSTQRVWLRPRAALVMARVVAGVAALIGHTAAIKPAAIAEKALMF